MNAARPHPAATVCTASRISDSRLRGWLIESSGFGAADTRRPGGMLR